MRWSPFVTVAAIIERDGRFLLVQESIDGKICLNQPAGHWEPDESLQEAVAREVLEETGWEFTANSILGIYHWVHPTNKKTYLRFAFTGKLGTFHPDHPLDAPIIAPCWLTHDELIAKATQHRSPQVLKCVQDYLAGRQYSLEMIQQVDYGR